MTPPPSFGTLTATGVAVVVLPLSGCGSSSHPAAGSGKIAGKITVLAAASLKNAFTAEGAAFMKAHPDALTTFSFAGSQALAAQLAQGAPADVFASADPTNLGKVKDASASMVFAHNLLTIVVPAGNPKGITGLADLANPSLKVVLAGTTVPAGKYAAQALAAAKIDVKPVTTTDEVTTVVSDVRLGQADAGISYVTDIRGVAGVEGVPIPLSQNVQATYPISTLTRSKNAVTAAAFVAFIESAQGQQILERAGFQGAA